MSWIIVTLVVVGLGLVAWSLSRGRRSRDAASAGDMSMAQPEKVRGNEPPDSERGRGERRAAAARAIARQTEVTGGSCAT